MPAVEKDIRKPFSRKNAEEHSFFLSTLFYCYFCPTICRGIRRPLSEADVYTCHSADSAKVRCTSFFFTVIALLSLIAMLSRFSKELAGVFNVYTLALIHLFCYFVFDLSPSTKSTHAKHVPMMRLSVTTTPRYPHYQRGPLFPHHHPPSTSRALEPPSGVSPCGVFW